MRLFAAIAEVVAPNAVPIPPWYIDFYKTQGTLAVIFLLVVLYFWKVHIPESKAREEKKDIALQRAEDRLIAQIEERKSQVLRSEERSDNLVKGFKESIDKAQELQQNGQVLHEHMLKSNDRQLDQLDSHLRELIKLKEGQDRHTELLLRLTDLLRGGQGLSKDEKA